MMKMKRCLIVTGGTIDIAFAKDFLSQRSYDYVIAAMRAGGSAPAAYFSECGGRRSGHGG